MTKEKKEAVLKNIVTDTFAKRTFRTIMIAYKDISFEEYTELGRQNNEFKNEHDREVLEKDLNIVGIFALYDPLRKNINKAVKRCQNAGINVRMVTGDNIDTATAISIEAGIVTKE